MALTLAQADTLIESGEAEEYLNRFIQSATQLSFEALAGQRQAEPWIDDALVAATVLVNLLQTQDARRELKLPPRRRSKTFDADTYALSSPPMMIGLQFHFGRISESDAIEALEHHFDSAQITANPKTIRSLLHDLSRRAGEVNLLLDHLESLADPQLDREAGLRRMIDAVLLGRKDENEADREGAATPTRS